MGRRPRHRAPQRPDGTGPGRSGCRTRLGLSEPGLTEPVTTHLTAAQLERYLHEQIPISRPLGVRVLAAGADVVRLGAPLEPNLNHRQTVFGGSLSAVAILAAWTWLYLRLGGPGFTGRIVIQNHGVEYLAPAEGDFVAT